MGRLPIRIDDAQRDRWEEYVDEEPAVDSLSDLVRTAVETYIADDTEGEPDKATLSGDAFDKLDRIDQQLRQLDDQVKAARQESLTEHEMEDLLRYVLIDEALDEDSFQGGVAMALESTLHTDVLDTTDR